MLKYVHVALFLPFCPMSENASLGTAFLPAIAKFRENVTLARRILPAGERSVRFDASDRWDLHLFTRKQAGSLMGPAMESGNGGLVPRCPWTVGSLSWGRSCRGARLGRDFENHRALLRPLVPRAIRSGDCIFPREGAFGTFPPDTGSGPPPRYVSSL